IGEKHWLKQAHLVKQDIQGHKYLKDYLLRRHSISFALTKYSSFIKRYKGIPPHELLNRDLYPAISFAAQTLSIYDNSSAQQKKRFIRRIHGAFKNADEMRAMQLELLAATHFVLRHYPVSWPEMDGNGNFDILVNDIGEAGLEIECKSISSDKGKRIHDRERNEFFDLTKKAIKSVSQGLNVGISVVMTLPKRLPSQHNERKILAQRVCDQIIAAQDQSFSDGSNIRINEFDFNFINEHFKKNNSSISMDYINQVTNTTNQGAMIYGNKNGGGVVFVIQSQQDDLLLDSIFSLLAKSAKSQVTKTRPALFIVGLHDLASGELREIAQQETNPNLPPTPLQIRTSDYLNSFNRDHIIGVSFLDNGSLQKKENGDVSSAGTAYAFKKDDSQYWHNDFSEIFQQ
ncbi:MAG: hypothetical protein OQK32_01630, partial [Gammaproteobacteria bacterium]|nr:hypothetical protein [Gammaproteobacteria bacterium]